VFSFFFSSLSSTHIHNIHTHTHTHTHTHVLSLSPTHTYSPTTSPSLSTSHSHPLDKIVHFTLGTAKPWFWYAYALVTVCWEWYAGFAEIYAAYILEMWILTLVLLAPCVAIWAYALRYLQPLSPDSPLMRFRIVFATIASGTLHCACGCAWLVVVAIAVLWLWLGLLGGTRCVLCVCIFFFFLLLVVTERVCVCITISFPFHLPCESYVHLLPRQHFPPGSLSISISLSLSLHLQSPAYTWQPT
jgi:hypothetical protein